MRHILTQLPPLFSIRQMLFTLVIICSAILVGTFAITYNEAFLLGATIAKERFLHTPYLLFICIPFFFLLGAYICRRFAPYAAGSGPEHVLAALNALNIPGKQDHSVSKYLGIKVLMVKIISSLLCIAGGGALGREGPVVQISAGIFYIIAQRIKHWFPSLDLRSWIVIGSATGVAAAFNTPLAGIIFAVEELALFKTNRIFISFKLRSLFTVIVASLTSQMLIGSHPLFFFPTLPLPHGMDYVAILVVALLCGFLSCILKHIISGLSTWRHSVGARAWFLFPILAGLVVATVSVNIGTHTFGSGGTMIQDALNSPTNIFNVQDVLGRLINIIASSASGCAGGLLLPGLALGASIGSFVSLILPFADPRTFIAVGMATFLGALINAPLTATILVLEVTNQRELVIPLFMAALIASWVFDKTNEYYIALKHATYFPHSKT